ncbi:MAG: sensor histidine kinase [Verrucomicrobiales bacterium]|nr:sensor histidine kinase [Verrucomicrobiales bacterium]
MNGKIVRADGQTGQTLQALENEGPICRAKAPAPPDDGAEGIPEADRERLFQAFHRGSNVRQIPGTGLGLLVVQRCVALHGGEIQFESAEGKGTTFTVRLPLFAGTA